MSKSTNDKIDEIFEANIIDEHPYGTEYDLDVVKRQIKQLIKETLQECIGEEETYEGHSMVWSIEHRNQLRKETLDKLDELLGDKKGLVGNLYGIKINHSNNVIDNRLHVEPANKCWCWNE